MKIIDLKFVFGFSFFSFSGFSSPHSPRREFVFVFMIYILCTKKKKKAQRNGQWPFNSFFGWATIWATDWAQIWQGLTRSTRPTRPNGGGFGPREKTRLVNGSGLGLGLRPASRVWVWKNLARTRPVAIPSINGFTAVLTHKEASKLSSNKQKTSHGFVSNH